MRYLALAAVLLASSLLLSQAGVDSGTASRPAPLPPFSCDTVELVDRTLANGTRIHQELHGRFFRDAQGRTRREQDLVTQNGETHHLIVIQDPVRKVFIDLQAQSKTADVRHYGGDDPDEDTATVLANVPASPPPQAKPSAMPGWTMEELGTREIEGYTVEGVRRIRTIAAGAMGNDQPIVATFEQWTSPELGIPLLTNGDDPQSGSRSVRYQNIVRGEPDPALFQVPADYTVQEADIGLTEQLPPSGPRVRVQQSVMQAFLVQKVDAQYPAQAREARIQGRVVLSVVVGKNGAVQDVKLVSGHPLLAPAAMDAVRQWHYKPYLLNGDAVEVQTPVTVDFRLPPP